MKYDKNDCGKLMWKCILCFLERMLGIHSIILFLHFTFVSLMKLVLMKLL